MVGISRIQLPAAGKRMLVQADYMSGDRYSVAAALNFNRDSCLLVLINQSAAAKGYELLEFYAEAVARGQVGFCITGESEILYHGLLDTAGAKSFNTQARTNIEFLPVTAGTKLVAEKYKGDPRAAVEELRKSWFGGVSRESDRVESELLTWLKDEMGMPPGKAYALLWVKTGAMTAEKAWHFTSAAAWQQLETGPNWLP